MLQVADSHGTHGRLDTRTSRHAALVNRESSCGLSSAEMVASGSGWGIGWMGERQDWPITAPFLDCRARRGRLGREMLVIAWLTALREGTEKARGGSMRSTVSFSGALGLAMMEWQLWAANGTRGEIGGRGQSSCSVCLQAGLYNPSVLPALKT